MSDKKSKDKREGWLKNLKAGDLVFIDTYATRSTATIEKITPAGYIYVSGSKFSPDGVYMSRSWGTSRLLEPTPAVKNAVYTKIGLKNIINLINEFSKKGGSIIEQRRLDEKIDYTKIAKIYSDLKEILDGEE